MDLALNNLQRLICHKTQQTKPLAVHFIKMNIHLQPSLKQLMELQETLLLLLVLKGNFVKVITSKIWTYQWPSG